MATSVIPVFSLIPKSRMKPVLAVALAAIGFTLFAAAFSAAAAEEAPEKVPAREMVFSIVRTSNTACEPDCPEWIAADGDITDKTAKAFETILKTVGERKLPLLVNSYGGRVDVAMTIGRLIRERDITVEVARTDYPRCEPWDEKCEPDFEDGTFYGYGNATFGVCNSACPILLGGGVRRIASPFARVGVHQIVTTREKFRSRYKVYKKTLSSGEVVTKRELVERKKIGTVRSTELRDSLRRDLANYLTAMDVKPALIDLMLSTPPEDIRYLSLEELKSLGVVTEINEIESLVGHRICKSSRRPENCLLR